MHNDLDDQSRVVTQLAALLREASRLAVQVNSDSFADEHRAHLLELVGWTDYIELMVNITQMCSPSARVSARTAGCLNGPAR